ncbi:MAG: sel1 repeat family protein [Desulfovibrionaceae bacterium]|nr:sel1 repeat family protein [Desulfovibrionaceae bacterium]
MTIRFVKHVLLLLAAATLCAGCIMSAIAEKQGRTAYMDKDYATAKVKFEEAAAQGNADAMYHLANMYVEGKGVPQDYAKAAGLLEQAAAQDHDDARLMLGLFYLYGDGVAPDPVRGAQLIKTSAENGNDVAMYYLGNLYASGTGVTRHYPSALYWLQQAKSAGFPVKDELLADTARKAGK